MTIDYDALTEQIMDGMKKSENGIVSTILKTEIGDSILGRFLPYKPDIKNSIYHYYHHGWMTSGGSYVSYLCPTTSNESCPICKRSVQMWKSDDVFLKEQSKKIRRKENWITNFYIVENVKNPSQSGTIKLFRFGKQVRTILDEALNGEDKEIFGKKIWRLDSKGCSFRINVKPNSDKKDAWPSYTASKFLPPSDLNLSDSQIMEILDGVIDHTKIFDKQLSYDELTLELQKNFIDDLLNHQSSEEDFTFGMKKSNISSSSDDKTDDQEELILDGNAGVKVQEDNKSSKEKDISDEIDDILADL